MHMHAHAVQAAMIAGSDGREGRWSHVGDGITDGGSCRTYVLIRDDLNTLNVSSSLENLLEDLLGDSGVQTTNVEGSLVWLRGGAARTAGAARRVEAIVAHGGTNSVGVHVGVLGNVERGVLTGSTAGRGGSRHLGRVVGHFFFLDLFGDERNRMRVEDVLEGTESIDRTKVGVEAWTGGWVELAAAGADFRVGLM